MSAVNGARSYPGAHPGARIQECGSRGTDPGARIQGRGSRGADPGERIQGNGSRGHGSRGTDSGMRIPDIRIQWRASRGKNSGNADPYDGLCADPGVGRGGDTGADGWRLGTRWGVDIRREEARGRTGCGSRKTRRMRVLRGFNFHNFIASLCWYLRPPSMIITDNSTYYISGDAEKAGLRKALDLYEELTCLKFPPATSEDKNKVTVHSGSGG